MTIDAAIIDQAIDWHLRQAGVMDDADWEKFVLWLEARPDHARAFDRVATGDRIVARLPDALAAPLAANDDERPSRRWLRPVAGGALAAGIVALLLPLALPAGADPYLLETAPGQRRIVEIADGTRIEMNGGTRLWLDRANLRVARLDAGEAVFHVHHDAGAPFTVRSGARTVQDVGTVFNVARSGSTLDVEVAEGSVLFAPEREAITLEAGGALSVLEDRNVIRRRAVTPAAVGGWRSGRLSFEGAQLSQVVETIHRRYGVSIVVSPDLSHRPFTGMVDMTGTADKDIPHLAALIGATWRRDGQKWILASSGAL